MTDFLKEKISDLSTPWSFDAKAWVKGIQKHLRCKAAAIGVIKRNKPQQDELIAAHGWTGPVMKRWLSGAKDGLRTAAAKNGIAVGFPGNKANSPLLKSGHGVVCMLPESINQDSWWWLMVTRDAKAFSAIEQEKAMHLLRRFESRFAMPYEIQLSRLIVGHDDRLIAADLNTKDRFLDKPALYDELLTAFHRVVDQRYSGLKDNQTRDMAVQVGKDSHWLCFTRRRAVAGSDTYHWYIELRPLDDDEVPVVGTVKDDRVAKAIGYLHDNFSDVPSLATLAKQTNMSQFHFHRLFTTQVGTSPKQYLLRKQLQMAKWMLRALRIPIGEIAELTGFSSHGHFTSTFHRMIGESPTEYRESFY